MLLIALESWHSRELVALSVGLAVLASYVALDVADRIPHAAGPTRVRWIVAAGLCLGGGIWTMHFVAMLAFRLPIAIHYDVKLTLLSLLVGVTASAAGFWIAHRPSQRRMSLALGGITMGAGVAAMHYAGMAAVEVNAAQAYDPLLLAASVAIAVAAATAAIALSRTPHALARRFGAALVMGTAIAGMHFTGMAAASFLCAPDVAIAATPPAPPGGLVTLVVLIAGAGAAICLVAVHADRALVGLAERDQAEMSRNLRRFRALFRNSANVILLVEADGRVRFAATAAIGIEPAGVEGRPLDELWRNQVPQPAFAQLRNVIVGQTPRCKAEVMLYDADKASRAFEMVAENHSHDLDVAGTIVSLYDITERKRAEEQVSRGRLLAEQASRAKTTLITTMSHELRTPLNAIIGFADLIVAEAFGSVGHARYVEYARDISRSGQRLLDDLNKVLLLSQIEAGELSLAVQAVALEEILEPALRPFNVVANERGIELRTNVEEGLSVAGDPRRLCLAVAEIVSNAVKFSPQGGTITVTARGAGGRWVEIAVEDRGIGIPAPMLQAVRQPFVQADGSLQRRYDGSGLGLAIACRLVEMHGGRVDIDSAEGAGTIVTLRLRMPAAQDKAA